MLSICRQCKSKHFTAGRAPRSCSACGSRRLAVIIRRGTAQPAVRDPRASDPVFQVELDGRRDGNRPSRRGAGCPRA